MESLNNYIVERIRIDNIKHPEFPVDGTLNEIADFLKERGFKEIKDFPSISMYTDYVVPFNKYKDNCFGIIFDKLSGNNIIIFADTSRNKISKSNMLYVINSRSAFNKYRKIWDNDDAEYELLDEDEFKKEMESYFN